MMRPSTHARRTTRRAVCSASAASWAFRSSPTGTCSARSRAISAAPRVWTDGDVQTMRDLATAASSELRARIAYSLADADRARLQMMADASEALASTFDPLDAIGSMLDVVIRSYASWSFVVLQPVPGEAPQIVARHRDPALRSLVATFMASTARAPRRT